MAKKLNEKNNPDKKDNPRKIYTPYSLYLSSKRTRQGLTKSGNGRMKLSIGRVGTFKRDILLKAKTQGENTQTSLYRESFLFWGYEFRTFLRSKKSSK